MKKTKRLPWNYDPAKASRIARLNRLKRKGLTLNPADKPALRAAADQAVLDFKPKT